MKKLLLITGFLLTLSFQYSCNSGKTFPPEAEIKKLIEADIMKGSDEQHKKTIASIDILEKGKYIEEGNSKFWNVKVETKYTIQFDPSFNQPNKTVDGIKVYHIASDKDGNYKIIWLGRE